MKTITLPLQGLRLRPLLRDAADRVVLLTVRDNERFAVVPTDESDDRDGLPDVERRAREHLPDGGRPAAHGKRFRLDDDRLTLDELLRTAEDDTTVFLAADGRIRFVLLALDGAGRGGSAVTNERRPARRDDDRPRERWRDEDDRPRDRRGEDRVDDPGLSPSQWVVFPIVFLLVPAVNVIVSSVLYHVWKAGQPRKARQINLLGFAVFGTHVLLLVMFFVISASFGGGNQPPVAPGFQPPQNPNLNPPLPPPIAQQWNNDPEMGLPARNAPEKADPASGLLAYWSFDEGRGGRPFNSGSAPPADPAHLHDCRWVAGKRNAALAFNGTSSWCGLVSGDELNFRAGDDLTVSAWFETRGRWGTVFLFRNGLDGGPAVCLAIEDGQLVGIIREDGGEARGPALIRTLPVNDGQWHHALLLRSKTDDRVVLFLDGREVGAKQASTNGAAGPITTNLRALGSERYFVLKNQFPEKQFFRGKIDEVCLYRRALMAEEIKTLAAAEKPPGSK